MTENADVVQRLLDAFNRDDADAVVALFDEDCVLREPPEMPDSPPEGFRGHDGIRAWMANLREHAIQFEATILAGRGEILLCELRGRGRGRAARVPFEWTAAAVLHLRNAKILRVEAFLTKEEAVEAAGLSS
jgi:ketosteroid isomerase-like protein